MHFNTAEPTTEPAHLHIFQFLVSNTWTNSNSSAASLRRHQMSFYDGTVIWGFDVAESSKFGCEKCWLSVNWGSDPWEEYAFSNQGNLMVGGAQKRPAALLWGVEAADLSFLDEGEWKEPNGCILAKTGWKTAKTDQFMARVREACWCTG